MSRTTWTAGADGLGLIAVAGCADNPWLQGRLSQYQKQQSPCKTRTN